MAESPRDQQCRNCRYAGGRVDLPFCKRYPAVRLSPEDPRVFWPTTNPEHWCGEWAPAKPQTIDEGAAVLARMVLLGDLTAARALADKLLEGKS